jgi:hypothetical protein
MAKRNVAKRKTTASAEGIPKKTSSTRIRKPTRKQAKQQIKTELKTHAPLPGSFKLAWHSVLFIKKFWRPFLGIVLVYAILNFIFASSILGNISSSVHDIRTTTHSSKLSNAIKGFGGLANSGVGQDTTLQTILLIIESLVIIWALRHLFAGEQIKVKQAYYNSTAPLIPFLIVLFVILLQVLPLVVSSAVLVLV